ncbi:MAG: SH3 domain-containing protein [Sphingobacteriales bacterium]|nr:MAG: SH3 domain-containing protein [Sphingobacteriales bacterium]
MRNLIALLLLLTPLLVSAQDAEYPDGVFSFEPGTTQKVFVNGANVRSQPNMQAPVLDSLRSNQSVTILEKDSIVWKIGERRTVWYRIQYSKNSQPATGFIWGGTLCVGFRKKGPHDLLFGISKTTSKNSPETGQSFPQNTGSVKLMQDTILVDEVSFEMPSGESLSVGSFAVESNHRLQNVAYTVKAGVSGEACGISGYEQYVLVTEDQHLVALPQLMSVGDADVYHHDEGFVFPNDPGGQPNIIVMKTEEMEKNERTGKEHTKRSRTRYTWDGTRLTKTR